MYASVYLLFGALCHFKISDQSVSQSTILYYSTFSVLSISWWYHAGVIYPAVNNC